MKSCLSYRDPILTSPDLKFIKATSKNTLIKVKLLGRFVFQKLKKLSKFKVRVILQERDKRWDLNMKISNNIELLSMKIRIKWSNLIDSTNTWKHLPKFLVEKDLLLLITHDQKIELLMESKCLRFKKVKVWLFILLTPKIFLVMWWVTILKDNHLRSSEKQEKLFIIIKQNTIRQNINERNL